MEDFFYNIIWGRGVAAGEVLEAADRKRTGRCEGTVLS